MFIGDADRYRVYVFDNDSHTYIDNTNPKYKYILCSTKGRPNALDFMLVSQLGFTLRQFGKKPKYYIVSNDKGFNAVVEYWQSRGYFINRLGIHTPSSRISTATMKRCKKAYNSLNKNCNKNSLKKKTHNVIKHLQGVNSSNIDEICGKLMERAVK